MKKLSYAVLAVVASLTLSSCGNSPESMVKKYEKACEAGDVVKASKIAVEIGSMDESKFTEDQLERIEEAAGRLEDAAMDQFKF